MADDIAALTDVTGPNVLNTLLERLNAGKLCTYVGDCLLSINPNGPTGENESMLGQWYRSCKPRQELPPHAMAIAHRMYRMVVNDAVQQTVVITGRSGSGKTETARKIVSQLLREARLSPRNGLGPQIVMAQHILTTMLTARTHVNRFTTRGMKMATFYFQPDGQMVSAAMRALCVDKWFLVDGGPTSGTFSIFYAMLGGLSRSDLQLYYLIDSYRLVSGKDGPPIFSGPEDHERHVDIFDFFMTSLERVGINDQTRNYAGREMSAVLAILAAILHLGNVEIAPHAQNGQTVITNPYELRAASDMLSVREDYLEGALLSTTVITRGEPLRRMNSVDEAAWTRDLLMVELYRCLLAVITARINAVLSANNRDQGPLTSVNVLEGVALEEDSATRRGGLETFFRNMAAERLQCHLYEAIFESDTHSCERERVKPYKVKYADNTEVINAVFGSEHGIIGKLTAVTFDPQGTPTALLSLMDGDRTLKKNGCYSSVAAAKSGKAPPPLAFCIKHSGIGPVRYSAWDFISKNRGSMPDSTRQLLGHSGNPLVLAMAAIDHETMRQQPQGASPDALFANRTFQRDLSDLLQTLDNGTLHYIRCIKPSADGAPTVVNSSLVADQLKECCIVETARQRKFGYSTCVSQEQFVRRYRCLAFSPLSRVLSLSDTCKAILAKTDLADRGVTLSKTSVFLRYWHVTKLHALKAEQQRSITLMQALVRGFLVRRRMRGVLRSRQQRTRGQAYPDHRRSEREFQSMSSGYSYDDGYGHDNSYDFGDGSGRDDYHRDLPSPAGRFSDSPSADSETTRFYAQVVHKVISTLPTLEAATWVKIIYMERGKQVAKVYGENNSIMIDGSQAHFDGERFGLGACRNPERDEETAYYRASVVEGMRLKRDSDGSIYACRLSEQPIFVMDLDNLYGGGSFSADVLLCQGQLPFERTIKIFDINEFRSKIALDLKQGRFSRGKLQCACVIGLSFGRDAADVLQTPCWMCVINVKALEALDSDEIVREAQHQKVRLEMKSPEEEMEKLVIEDTKKRHLRGRWARTDQRDHLQEKEKGGRHVRQQLRAKGLPVGQNLGYSWNSERGTDNATMEDLQELVSPHLRAARSRGSGQARDWAKVETALKVERNRSFEGSSTAGF